MRPITPSNQMYVPVNRVLVNPEQPRKIFIPAELEELAQSIREHNVIQPIAVEEMPTPTGEINYMLHDGERRWRAAKMAGVETIPAIVTPTLNGTGSYERLVRALVANVQHVPMSPVDDALAIARLRNEHKLNNREISKRIGKAEAWISVRLRLSELETEILDLMRARKLSTEDKAVRAFFSITNPSQRIQLAKALAAKKATANMIVHACSDFVRLGKSVRANEAKGKRSETSASTMAKDAVVSIREKQLPEWDALYQLGKVPPFPLINDVVMRTCDACTLRPMACEAICGQCALVTALQDMMATMKAEGVIRA